MRQKKIQVLSFSQLSVKNDERGKNRTRTPQTRASTLIHHFRFFQYRYIFTLLFIHTHHLFFLSKDWIPWRIRDVGLFLEG